MKASQFIQGYVGLWPAVRATVGQSLRGFKGLHSLRRKVQTIVEWDSKWMGQYDWVDIGTNY